MIDVSSPNAPQPDVEYPPELLENAVEIAARLFPNNHYSIEEMSIKIDLLEQRLAKLERPTNERCDK